MADSSPQDALGGVLRDRGEAERHVGGQRQVELGGSFAVDVDDLAMHLDARVEHSAQYAHTLEHFERARLPPMAFAYCGGSSSGSTMRQSMARRVSSIAAVSPIGPAPAIKTGVSAGPATV
jgi:hypothetical protein